MFGTGLLKGLSVTLGHFTRTYNDDRKQVPSRYEDSIELGDRRRVVHQPVDMEGLITIQYPEERRILPERFRYLPMLLWDTEKGEDRCTACGICAKVCPPQCIWIVRDSDDAGKPVTRPAEFYIDAAVCMSCGYCAEFCPFDAIKMNHDVELAVFDRYPQLVYDKAELTVPIEYYAALWPKQYAAEEKVRAEAEEAERAKEEAKQRAAAEKAKQAAGQPKRTPEEIEAMKKQAAERSAAARSKTAGADGGADKADADAKRARLEELKRKAAERAQQRREEDE